MISGLVYLKGTTNVYDTMLPQGEYAFYRLGAVVKSGTITSGTISQSSASNCIYLFNTTNLRGTFQSTQAFNTYDSHGQLTVNAASTVSIDNVDFIISCGDGGNNFTFVIS